MATCVIGAGIAGLTAAHGIAKAGGDVVVLEAQDRVGGRLQTVHRGDFTFDIGAFVYLGSYDDAIALMREVGLGPSMHRFPAYGAMPRDGQLHYFDLDKPVRSVGGTKYLSAASKVKLTKLLVLLGRTWKDLNYADASGVAALDVETVTEYCRRELNDEILDYLAAVIVRGPWLSDPDWTSVGQLLWTMKNFFKPYFYGLDDGMDALPRALAARLDVRTGHRVLDVTDTGTGVEVTYDAGEGERTETFDDVVLTTPADTTLELYPQLAGAARTHYENTEYLCSVNTHLALARRPANPATYIMCSPREQPDLCGVIVDHLKANNRCRPDQGMLTVFCRHEWCLEHLDAPDEVILDEVYRFLARYYGDLAPDHADHEIGRWRRVVPLMKVGRFKSADAFMRATDPRARVQLAGDLGPIPGVNAALVSGKAAGERIVARGTRATEPVRVGR